MKNTYDCTNMTVLIASTNMTKSEAESFVVDKTTKLGKIEKNAQELLN